MTRLWLLLFAGLTMPATNAAGAAERLSPVPSQRCDDQAPIVVPFTAIGQGDSFTADLASPTLLPVSDPREADRLAGLLDDADLVQRIAASDLADQPVLVLFGGRQSSTGYALDVVEVRRSASIAQVWAKLIGPAPGQNASSVISYPYVVVRLARSDPSAGLPRDWQVCGLGDAFVFRR